MSGSNLSDAINYSIYCKGDSIVITVNETTKTFAANASWAGFAGKTKPPSRVEGWHDTGGFWRKTTRVS